MMVECEECFTVKTDAFPARLYYRRGDGIAYNTKLCRNCALNLRHDGHGVEWEGLGH